MLHRPCAAWRSIWVKGLRGSGKHHTESKALHLLHDLCSACSPIASTFWEREAPCEPVSLLPLKGCNAAFDHLVIDIAIRGHHEVARCRDTLEDAAGQVKAGTVAGTNITTRPITPANGSCRLKSKRWNAVQVRADTYYNEVFRLDGSVGILRIGRLLCILK